MPWASPVPDLPWSSLRRNGHLAEESSLAVSLDSSVDLQEANESSVNNVASIALSSKQHAGRRRADVNKEPPSLRPARKQPVALPVLLGGRLLRLFLPSLPLLSCSRVSLRGPDDADSRVRVQLDSVSACRPAGGSCLSLLARL